ncbi:SbcC/MukB-like Walker B domain-containing protein [Alicyclobacillus sp. ALC3]|uniref:SbcC/MukB-like Walker B domain-containing protein n=1 Tax=Alicyclobacillus sp. ALC3 TaxID=2796143 RepID=UPI002377E92E|nr:SbcC/MukB-like Walker B domain-containing protein [Alicyclobacillus sp. ALC3]WDL98629.1 TIGR02680 family protein [Alicyclobacillus sp. ALC3]
MNTQRWRMNRAGIFNFWYYEDVEFELSDGRLIFRGPNGSGKSVSMQSFLPLVLDGDKRPSRLDPFGSRDRKVEYYLLGDSGEDYHDRIGYLYLEFVQPQTAKRLTVGIGLHAVRGRSTVGFWGFAVTDGRQVGKDLLLYDEREFVASGQKVPLDRPALEAVIADGGKVVREQGEYSRLVNQQLFGFDDAEAYRELLNLLLQLRSPKLSKDLKPSKIYETLTAALPPLGEDELRPLSDVLGDLDEISSRLEELRVHRAEAESLAGRYADYNQHRLYRLAADAVGSEEKRAAAQSEADESARRHTAAVDRLTALQADLAQATEQEQLATAEIAALEQSEGMEKQKQLEDAVELLHAYEQRAAEAERHARLAEAEAVNKRDRQDKLKAELTGLGLRAEHQREELTAFATEMEFSDHAVYESAWTAAAGAPEGKNLGGWNDENWAALERDAESYRGRLREAERQAAQVRVLAERKASAEAQMSSARAYRDSREQALQQAEQNFDAVLTAQEDDLLRWRQNLRVTQVADETWYDVMRRLRRYPETAYSDVLEPIVRTIDTARVQLQREEARLGQERQVLTVEIEQKEKELWDWKSKREPEPPRSEAAERARQRRKANIASQASGEAGDVGFGDLLARVDAAEHAAKVGAPLYAVCEFRDTVDDATRGAIETALWRAGLVDAWIAADGWQLPGDDEDTVMVPSREFAAGPSLADYLAPMPPADCGLTAAQVEDVLRTIRMEADDDAAGTGSVADSGSATGTGSVAGIGIAADSGSVSPAAGDSRASGGVGDVLPGGAVVSPRGRYRIGPLSGQVEAKPRAEWIGAEARRQTRLATIAQLQAELAALRDRLQTLDEAIAEVQEHLDVLADERDSVPRETPLQVAADALRGAQVDLSRAIAQELATSDHFKEAQRLWREAQQVFHELASMWQRLRTEEDFSEAGRTMERYLRRVTELRSTWTVATAKAGEFSRLAADAAAADTRAGEERRALREIGAKVEEVRIEVEALRKVLEDLGMYDIYERIEQLRQARNHAKEEAGRLREAESVAHRDVGGAEEKAKRAAEAVEAAAHGLTLSLRRLQSDWALDLVDVGEDSEVTEAAARLEARARQSGTQLQVGGDERDGLDAHSLARSDWSVAGAEAWLRFARVVMRKFRARFEQRREEQVRDALTETFTKVSTVLVEYGLERFEEAVTGRMMVESRRGGRAITPAVLAAELRQMEEQQSALIDEKDRELYEQILLHSVGRAIRDRINRAEQWVDQMNRFMAARRTSSGLILSLAWSPRPAQNERELDTDKLLALLRKSTDALRQDEVEEMMAHFKSRIDWAKQAAEDGTSLRQAIGELLDYRQWFTFTLFHKKGDSPRRELTDARFNVMSGGEKAMAMYIPLFAAADSRYKDSHLTAPRIIALDEAFAGVDEDNLKDMFELITDMDFDYMMTSQVLWGCYETVPALSIYEIHRPNDAHFVTLFPYYWNGTRRSLVTDGDWDSAREAAVSVD